MKTKYSDCVLIFRIQMVERLDNGALPPELGNVDYETLYAVSILNTNVQALDMRGWKFCEGTPHFYPSQVQQWPTRRFLVFQPLQKNRLHCAFSICSIRWYYELSDVFFPPHQNICYFLCRRSQGHSLELTLKANWRYICPHFYGSVSTLPGTLCLY